MYTKKINKFCFINIFNTMEKDNDNGERKGI